MKKHIIIIGSVVLIFIIVLFIFILKKDDKNTEDKLIAIIEYGHNNAADFSIYCEYDIYAKGKKKYTYELECTSYTIEGEQPTEKLESGNINKKEDFDKIKDSIDKFKKTNNYTYDSYYYIDNYEKRLYDSFDSLIKKLY